MGGKPFARRAVLLWAAFGSLSLDPFLSSGRLCAADDLTPGADVLRPGSPFACHMAFRGLLNLEQWVAGRFLQSRGLLRRIADRILFRGNPNQGSLDAVKELDRVYQALSVRSAFSPDYVPLTERLVKLVARHFGDDPFLLQFARSELDARARSPDYPADGPRYQKLKKALDEAQRRSIARTNLEAILVSRNEPMDKLIKRATDRASQLLGGREPAKLIDAGSGAFLPTADLAAFQSGEIYSNLRARGQSLGAGASRLADAYDKIARGLRAEEQAFSGKYSEIMEMANLATTLGVPMAEEDGRLVLRASGEPSLAADRLRFLLATTEKQRPGDRLKAVVENLEDLALTRSHDLIIRDRAWGFLTRSLYDVINEPHRFRFMNRSLPQATNRQYREHRLTPDDFDPKTGELRTPLSRLYGINGQGNWTLAGAVPPGKSQSPLAQREGEWFRIIYWDGSPIGEGADTMGANVRVAENWEKVRGKWVLRNIEVMARTSDKEWTPFVFETNAETGKFEPDKAKNCAACHGRKGSLFATFGPAVQTKTLGSNGFHPFRIRPLEADAIATRQGENFVKR